MRDKIRAMMVDMLVIVTIILAIIIITITAMDLKRTHDYNKSVQLPDNITDTFIMDEDGNPVPYKE